MPGLFGFFCAKQKHAIKHFKNVIDLFIYKLKQNLVCKQYIFIQAT